MNGNICLKMAQLQAAAHANEQDLKECSLFVALYQSRGDFQQTAGYPAT
ncbi:hypothetical protein RA280_25720 [Cupriavidus sp. CV2]|nr:hypothetical protein [Cupriavidus sp. CV2]MDW3685087.1 hypothetical protein [Cupriavidus sp. CV2]